MLEPQPGAGPTVDVADPAYRRAFAVTDQLAVHGADCVCPPCAGRLTGLLGELARAIGQTER